MIRRLAIVALALLLPGLFLRVTGERYSVRLALLSFAMLGFAYVSISAPIDRIASAVEEAKPEDYRTQLYR